MNKEKFLETLNAIKTADYAKGEHAQIIKNSGIPAYCFDPIAQKIRDYDALQAAVRVMQRAGIDTEQIENIIENLQKTLRYENIRL